jgi:dTDP-4-dehydrorhamnose 3,5-epimerase
VRFIETELAGAFVVELEPNRDERGFFARAYDAKLFEAHGMNPFVAQTNLAYNVRRATLRGLHYQRPPATETKFIRCVRGAVYDVIVDLREGSPTCLRHVGVELSAANRRALYLPGMFAHGYQTLEDETDVLYQVGEFYTPGVEAGLRHDDPALGIEWPLETAVISQKDRAWPLLAERAEVVG